jgi:hypothetical protein
MAVTAASWRVIGWNCEGTGDSRFPTIDAGSYQPGDPLYAITGFRPSVTSETLVAPTWRLFDLARTATTVVGLLSILGGSCGRFLSMNPRRRTRSCRLTLGGGIALVCVVSLEAVYRAISWAVGGGTHGLSSASALLPKAARSTGLYGAPGTADTIALSTAGTVARTAAVSGLAAVCLGCGLWAVGTTRGPLQTAGIRGIALGVALLAISVGAELFDAINYALVAGWSA